MDKTIKLPNLKIAKLRKIVLTVLAVCLIFSVGFIAGNNQLFAKKLSISDVKIDRSIPGTRNNVDFSLFWRVWDSLEESYFDKSRLDPGKMVYGAIKGMVEAVGDPYTAFLEPSENKVVEEDLSGSFQGVGIQIGFKGTQLAVVAPMPGTPADEAGLKAGDFIIGIKDEKKGIDRGTVGISLPDAVEAIRGPAGSKVTLLIVRDGSDEPITFDLVRRDIIVPSVVLEFVGDNKNIAHLKLMKFGGETEKEWNEKVQEILKSKADRIILDVRNNPGGYLQGAVDLAGDFLPNGSVVVIEEGSGKRTNEYKTNSIPRLKQYPLVVLVNGGSASASEILSGALRDKAQIKIVGTKTFGKGTIQEPRKLDGGAGIHITIAKWLTPNKTWVNEKGLEPDVIIDDEVATSDDEQLIKAIETVGTI